MTLPDRLLTLALLMPFLAHGQNTVAKVWDVQTNILAWGIGVANTNVRWHFNDRWSVGVPVYYSPWKISHRHFVKVLGTQPELRFDIGHSKGVHSVGIHLTVAEYNAGCGATRYQDTSRPLLGAGISYAWSKMITPRLGMEASLGVGYINTEYNGYRNVSNGALKFRRSTNYLGIDHAGFSFFYRFML